MQFFVKEAKTVKALILVASMLLILGCEARTDKSDTGGVLLEVELVDFPVRASVNAADVVQIPTIEIDSIVINPNRPTSQLMNVAVDSVEVRYFRADGGTRVPTPYIARLIGTVPVGGTLTFSNIPVLSIDQMRNPPLSDLLFINGGFDKETGKNFITLNMEIRVFGKTLSGDDVASEPRLHRLELVQ